MARAALLASALVLGLANAATIRVKPNPSGTGIQAALNQANPGDQIIVEAGPYKEYLLVSKNNIDLQARSGVILSPPDTPPPADWPCTGLAGEGGAGICIAGTNVDLGPFDDGQHRKVITVGTYVENVRVKGFDVRGFVGLNIAIVGAKKAEVRENKLIDGTSYGILTVGSIGTRVARNTVRSSGTVITFVGICMDDKSDVDVSSNEIEDRYIGLCVQTHNAEVTHNKVSNCCIGAYVDPGVDGAHLAHNKIGPTNPLCVGEGAWNPGIVLDGATNSEIHRNDVSGTVDGNPDWPAAGILIKNSEKGLVATGNSVSFNDLSTNEADVVDISTGHNEVTKNHCTLSIPSGGCS